jgi:hypothetical protein
MTKKITVKERHTDEIEWNQAVKVMWALGLFEEGAHWSKLQEKLLNLARVEKLKERGRYRLIVPMPKVSNAEDE